MQTLVVASHTVYVHVGGTKNFGGRWGPVSLGRGVADPLETRYSPTCYHSKFRSSSNRLGVGRRVPKTGGSWGPVPLEGRD